MKSREGRNALGFCILDSLFIMFDKLITTIICVINKALQPVFPSIKTFHTLLLILFYIGLGNKLLRFAELFSFRV